MAPITTVRSTKDKRSNGQSVQMDPFPDTKSRLEEIFACFACSKCSKLPRTDVWMLSSCQHKYCKKCFSTLDLMAAKAKVKKCSVCSRVSPIESSLPDLFTTNLLHNLRLFQKDCLGMEYLDTSSFELEELDTPEDESLQMREESDDDAVFNNINEIQENSPAIPIPSLSDRNFWDSSDSEEELMDITDEVDTIPVRKNCAFSEKKTVRMPLVPTIDEEGDDGHDENLPLADMADSPTTDFDDDDENRPLSDFMKRSDNSSSAMDIQSDEGASDAEEVEVKKVPPPRKFFKQSRAERFLTKPTISPAISKEPKKPFYKKGIIAIEKPAPKKAEIAAKVLKPHKEKVANEKSVSASSTRTRNRPEPQTPDPKITSAPTSTRRKPIANVNDSVTNTKPVLPPLFTRKELIAKTPQGLVPKKPQTSSSETTRKEPTTNRKPISDKKPESTVMSTPLRNVSTLSITTPSSSMSNGSAASLTSPSAVSKRNGKGETPLHIAARNGHTVKILQLLEASADINAKDFAGWTPLHEAITGKTQNAFSVAETLLTKDCQVNAIGGFGNTALHEAARLGKIDLVKLLLSYGASKEIPNEDGLVPAQVAKTKEIGAVINCYKGPFKRKVNHADALSISMCLRQSQSLIFFACQVDSTFANKVSDIFKIRVAGKITKEVTHIIFDSKPTGLVGLSTEYLHGMLIGAWLLSLEWAKDSLSAGNLLEPDSFEIGGYVGQSSEKSLEKRIGKKGGRGDAGLSEPQKRSRINRERKNPGLFHGMCFYIYKNSAYDSNGLKLNKQALSLCIYLGDGIVLNREPNPDTVDPLDNPVRFHAQDQKHELVLTSTVILFGQGNEPPKKHNLEHVKSLRVNWLIQSVLNFSLLDTSPFHI